MAEPTIADRQPAVLTLAPETYQWCSCGLSTTQPFCNGSHQGSEFKPVKFEITEAKQVALCQCKHTSTQPFCDGTHAKLA